MRTPLPFIIAALALSQGQAQSIADLAAPRPLGVAELPGGFAEEVIATGLTGATSMAVAPDGRVFVCEQTGSLRVVKDDQLLGEPFVRVKVDSSWERGLLGVAVDPEFPRRPYIDLLYVSPEPYPHHRISRFTALGDAAAPGSEVVLLEGDDQRKLGGRVPNGHQGGGLHFGQDGKLYAGIGEQTAGLPSQKLDTFQGKLLRIDPDGSIPPDNPFSSTAAGKYRAIWAYGLRNPFGFAIEPGTGRMLINDVGEARWEEIDEGVAGANYGWPHAEGPSADPRFRSPIHAYDRSQGKSISGGTFYDPPVVQFPEEYRGKYFFAEFIDSWIMALDVQDPREPRPFAAGLAGPVDVQVAPDGSLYILNRNAWVIDEKFKPGTGSLVRVRYVPKSGKPAPIITIQPVAAAVGVGQKASFQVEAEGEAPLRFRWHRNGRPLADAAGSTLSVEVKATDDGAEFRCLVSNAHGAAWSWPAALWTSPPPKLIDALRVGPEPWALPPLLSGTGIFRSLEDLEPAPGVLPYEVNTPLWSDGADKRRWLILPEDSRIGFARRGAWKFPPGTVLVKHFELPAGGGRPPRRLETRLLVVDRRGSGYGVTYRWRADGRDAELLPGGLTEEIDRGGQKQMWSYPSRGDCLVCHTTSAGFVLGVNTRQLNRSPTDRAPPASENLLRKWDRAGLFQPALGDEDLSRLERLRAVDDPTAPSEQKVRSYLDVNCAQCHRPGGTRAEFDARFEAPGGLERLVNASLTSSDLGVDGSKLVVAGDVDRSMLCLRMRRRQDVFNMPPLATHLVDAAAVALLAEWIRSLSAGARPAAPPAGRIGEGQVRVSEVTLHGDMDCFKVETPAATYVYGKKGAGFAALIDPEGHDWISYHPGDLAKGEYRGMPKCGQPTKFFHAGYGYGQYRTENVFSSRVAMQSDDHVRIESETRDGKSACAWDFYPRHATLTLLRIDLPTYWFLYEGVPGGRLDADRDFVIRPDGTRTTLDQPWSQLVRWVCFGAAESRAGLLCIDHQEPEDGETDSYVSWPFQKDKDGSFQDMTVFGFGRKGYKELVEHIPDLKRLPARFSIALVAAADHPTASAAYEMIRGLDAPARPSPAAQPIRAPLKALSTNPRYFADPRGKAIYLTGSHTWNDLQDWGTDDSPRPFDFNAYVKMLLAHHHNFTLLWATELPTLRGLPATERSPPDFSVAPHPWPRTGPGRAADGKLKFDLSRFDPAYFDRLRSRVRRLNEAGIYAGVYLFTGEFLLRFRFAGDGYPLTGSNNVNGIDDGGGLGAVTMTAPNALTEAQDRYVREVIDTINDLPNVLWIVSEEAPSGSEWWNAHLIALIRAYEAGKPLQHPIGYGALDGGQDATLIESDADWIAPLARISATSSCGSGHPPCKVNINDSDHSYFGMWNDSPQVNRNYFWINFTNGSQTLFMDPYVVHYPRERRNLCPSPVHGIGSGPDPRWDPVRDTMGFIRDRADRMDLAAMTPRPELASTGHALATTGSPLAEVLVYAPSGGGFTVDLGGAGGEFAVEWMDPATGQETRGQDVPGGAPRAFATPFGGDAVLYLRSKG